VIAESYTTGHVEGLISAASVGDVISMPNLGTRYQSFSCNKSGIKFEFETDATFSGIGVSATNVRIRGGSTSGSISIARGATATGLWIENTEFTGSATVQAIGSGASDGTVKNCYWPSCTGGPFVRLICDQSGDGIMTGWNIENNIMLRSYSTRSTGQPESAIVGNSVDTDTPPSIGHVDECTVTNNRIDAGSGESATLVTGWFGVEIENGEDWDVFYNDIRGGHTTTSFPECTRMRLNYNNLWIREESTVATLGRTYWGAEFVNATYCEFKWNKCHNLGSVQTGVACDQSGGANHNTIQWNDLENVYGLCHLPGSTTSWTGPGGDNTVTDNKVVTYNTIVVDGDNSAGGHSSTVARNGPTDGCVP
jgi:hypothetical protein